MPNTHLLWAWKVSVKCQMIPRSWRMVAMVSLDSVDSRFTTDYNGDLFLEYQKALKLQQKPVKPLMKHNSLFHCAQMSKKQIYSKESKLTRFCLKYCFQYKSQRHLCTRHYSENMLWHQVYEYKLMFLLVILPLLGTATTI